MSIVAGVDTTDGDQDLDDFNNRVLASANQAVGTVNRVTEMSLLALQALGFAVDATFRVYAQALRTGINTVIQVDAALKISNPALAAQTVLTGGVSLYLLYAQLQALNTGRSEVSAQMQASYTLLRTSGGIYL